MRLTDIASREVEACHLGAQPREHDARHSMAAPVIQHSSVLQVAQSLERGPDPGFVAEVDVVIDEQLVGPADEAGCPVLRLAVVKQALSLQPIHGIVLDDLLGFPGRSHWR